MAVLYSYCIPVDDGAAPNPYWGICTLAICKPVIRRNAKPGDWVVATGSKKYGMENKVVYAMRITEVMTLAKYNKFCSKKLPFKIPDLNALDLTKRAGDCIYFEVNGDLLQRKGVHGPTNRDVDVNGKNVLLSKHFYYFGDQPISLPTELLSIVLQGQGHRSRSNAKFVSSFIKWILTSQQTKPYKNKLKSQPKLLEVVFRGNKFSYSSKCRKKESIEDEKHPQKC
jgi:hypothetical protein